MTEERIGLLWQRMIEDMRIRGMGDKAQKSRIRAIRDFTALLGRVETVTLQLWQAAEGSART